MEGNKMTRKVWKTMGQNSGFSLVELMTTITIVALVATIVAPPLIDSMKSYSHRAAARDLMNSAQGAKSIAVRENRNCSVTFDAAAKKFTLDPGGTNQRFYDASTYGSGIRLVDDSETTCGNASQTWSGTAIAPATSIGFNSRGRALTPNTVYMENTVDGVCYALSITIPGSLRLRKYNGGTPFSTGNWQD